MYSVAAPTCTVSQLAQLAGLDLCQLVLVRAALPRIVAPTRARKSSTHAQYISGDFSPEVAPATPAPTPESAAGGWTKFKAKHTKCERPHGPATNSIF